MIGCVGDVVLDVSVRLATSARPGTDTLAAGDVFAAGFLVAKTVKNLSWEEAITAAIDSASDLLASRNRYQPTR